MLVAVALAAVSLQQGLFKQVIGTPTGANGYEEYVLAAERLSGPRASAFLTFQPSMLLNAPSDGEGLEQRSATAAFLNTFGGKDWLDVKRQFHKEFSGVLELIRRGNAKPVTAPRIMTSSPDGSFPVFARLKNIARLASQSSDALVADNKSAQAVQVNMDMVTFSMNLRGATLISNLVSLAIQAIALASFDVNLDRFSERDWQTVLSQTKPLLARGNQLSQVADFESSSMLNTLADALGRSDLESKPTPAQKAAYLAKLDQHLTRWAVEFKRMVSQPESEWKEVVVTVTDPEMAAIADVINPAGVEALMANAKATTQLRLLKLHALVQIYRYKWNKLPDTLPQAVDQAGDRHDPLATGEFMYEKLNQRSYRLYSRGNKLTGEIDLKFVRQPGEPEGSTSPERGSEVAQLVPLSTRVLVEP